MHACPGSYKIGLAYVCVLLWLLVEQGELCAGLVGRLGGWVVGWLGGLVGGFEGCWVGWLVVCFLLIFFDFLLCSLNFIDI